MTFGQFIRAKRTQLNISQAPLMDALNTTRSRISKLENGGLQWDLETVIQVAPVFGCKAWELVKEYQDTLAIALITIAPPLVALWLA